MSVLVSGFEYDTGRRDVGLLSIDHVQIYVLKSVSAANEMFRMKIVLFV